MKRMKLKPDIRGFIWRLSGDDRVISLLEFSLGRVLENAANRNEPVWSMVTPEQARHVADWLTAATINGDAWLRNYGQRGQTPRNRPA
jgi:hypothetical protein